MNMKLIPTLENEFYHEGRGPELQDVVWVQKGVILKGFNYYNPDDIFEEQYIKHIIIVAPQIIMQASEETHPNMLHVKESKASIVKVLNSDWLSQFKSSHLSKCNHFQIVFYDEIYDIICNDIIAGKGRLK